MAAALAYESLPAEARDAWLEALDADAPGVNVPKVALYAPLLAVESDGLRRTRIERALSSEAPVKVPVDGRGDGVVDGVVKAPVDAVSARHAFRGTTLGGETLCVVASPLYLDFVELLVCRFGADGISSARHEPLSHRSHLREQNSIPEAEGVTLEPTPLAVVVEELAHAVVAHGRAGREAPEVLRRFTDLFAPTPGSLGE
jgi:hypothetical protein